jgi:hypothetical protein
VVDDDPPTREQTEAARAAAVGRSTLRIERVPPVGGLEPIGRSLRLSNRRFRAAAGWAPAVRAGLDGWSLIAAEREAA